MGARGQVPHGNAQQEEAGQQVDRPQADHGADLGVGCTRGPVQAPQPPGVDGEGRQGGGQAPEGDAHRLQAMAVLAQEGLDQQHRAEGEEQVLAEEQGHIVRGGAQGAEAFPGGRSQGRAFHPLRGGLGHGRQQRPHGLRVAAQAGEAERRAQLAAEEVERQQTSRRRAAQAAHPGLGPLPQAVALQQAHHRQGEEEQRQEAVLHEGLAQQFEDAEEGQPRREARGQARPRHHQHGIDPRGETHHHHADAQEGPEVHRRPPGAATSTPSVSRAWRMRRAVSRAPGWSPWMQMLSARRGIQVPSRAWTRPARTISSTRTAAASASEMTAPAWPRGTRPPSGVYARSAKASCTTPRPRRVPAAVSSLPDRPNSSSEASKSRTARAMPSASRGSRAAWLYRPRGNTARRWSPDPGRCPP